MSGKDRGKFNSLRFSRNNQRVVAAKKAKNLSPNVKTVPVYDGKAGFFDTWEQIPLPIGFFEQPDD